MKLITLELFEYFAKKLGEKIDKLFVRKENGKGLSSEDYTAEEKNKLAGIEDGANKYVHPDSTVTEGTYKSVTVDAKGHVTGGSNPTTLEEYGITDAANKSHQHENGDILSVDASKITTGTIDIARLPVGALERCVVVTTDEARFALTESSIQIGDTVKVTETNKMYFVVDDSKLDSEEGYEVYTAGTATSVPWAGITDKPSVYPPETHSHSEYLTTSGTAAAAKKLATARTINGTSFDGTQDITTANWGTARSIKIGDTAKSVNGSEDVAWTLAEAGILEATAADIDNIIAGIF